jgi:hypothetical protein
MQIAEPESIKDYPHPIATGIVIMDPVKRVPWIVPSNRHLRFDGPHFPPLRIGDPASLMKISPKN